MIKATFIASFVLIVLHLLAAAGFVGWLHQSDRLNQERLDKMVEIFTPTFAEEEAMLAEAEQQAADEAVAATQAARIERIGMGPRTLQDELVTTRTETEQSIQQLERLQREIMDIRRQIDRAQNQLTAERAALDSERAAFEADVDKRTSQFRDEDFQQAVDMIRRLDPGQAKQMLQTMLGEGKQEEVVDYLSAMPVRSATAILGEFTEPDEIVQATTLVEDLRLRMNQIDGTTKP